VTNVSTRRWADPFGGARGTSPTGWTGDHGFLNKVADATGLTAVGARFYDSLIGRFVSVDPVLNGADPQQWNGYAYSQNNPVTWSDPSGLLSWGSALKSASGWYKQHQAQIWGVAAGIIVTAGCMAITFGAGSIACAAAGGAAAGAVTNVWASKIAHTQTFSWKSLIVDTVIGGVIGAATGGLGKLAAPLMSRAGTAIATTAKTLAARAPAAARAATGAIGRAASSIGRASSSTARAALRSETRVGTANTAEGAGVVRYGPGAQRAGEPSWPRPTQDNCTQCAQEIQGIMGGERAMIRPNAPGAKVLGPSANNPGGDWAYHDVVVSGGRVYDGFTGPNGLPFDQFKAQFDYPDAIDFGF